MILKQENFTKKVRFKTITMKEEQEVDRAATIVLKQVEKKVGKLLTKILTKRLYGFTADMQQEMAYNMLCFIRWQEGYLTGCPTADYVLAVNYIAIAKQLGFYHENEQEIIQKA